MGLKQIYKIIFTLIILLVFIYGCDPNQPLFVDSEENGSTVPHGSEPFAPEGTKILVPSYVTPTVTWPVTIAPTATTIMPTFTKEFPTSTPEPDTHLDIKAIGYDEYWKFNSLLVSHAMKKIGSFDIRNAGEYEASFSLKRNASYGLFAWCFSKEDRLNEVLSKLSYTVWVNGHEINTGNFEWLFNRDTHGNYCAVPGALVTNIEQGTYHIIILETLREPFSDAIGPYEIGDYIYNLNITFE